MKFSLKREFKIFSNNDLFPIFIKGFGRFFVKGLNLNPFPPANIKTAIDFISKWLFKIINLINLLLALTNGAYLYFFSNFFVINVGSVSVKIKGALF